GVGLSVDRAADGSTAVSDVLPGSPAAAAGIAVGDRLLRVDGAAADQLPVTDVVARLRGRQAGSTVAVAVQRADGPGRDLVLTRAELATREVAVRHPAP
ncbi:PDZ domain-containing protein, partial [Kitasatospora sp. MBT63]